MADIKVTQADRKAVVNLLGGISPKGLLDGKRDNLSVIQSLARHRIEAQRPLIEALEYARRFMKPEDFDLEYIDAAIKQAKG